MLKRGAREVKSPPPSASELLERLGERARRKAGKDRRMREIGARHIRPCQRARSSAERRGESVGTGPNAVRRAREIESARRRIQRRESSGRGLDQRALVPAEA